MIYLRGRGVNGNNDTKSCLMGNNDGKIRTAQLFGGVEGELRVNKGVMAIDRNVYSGPGLNQIVEPVSSKKRGSIYCAQRWKYLG